MADKVVHRRELDGELVRELADSAAPVFVDFDYTLFACNSTELFISRCKPSLLAAVIDFVVRGCVPWRLLPGERWFRVRDYVCCLVLLVLTPWNYGRWRRVAPELFARYASPDVARAFEPVDAGRVSIISFGMACIVRPLLRGSRWQGVPLIATPLLCRPSLLLSGKRAVLTDAVGAGTVARCSFVTDSLDDADLLAAAGTGVLIEPEGEPFRASEHLYIPLRYTARAKYTLSYVLDQVILVELALLAIATSRSLADLPLTLLLAGLLYLSLMCVYEIGYFENDMAAARAEARPRVTPAAQRFRSYPLEPSAWIWAAVLAIAAVAVMRASGRIGSLRDAGAALLAWAAATIVLRLVFHAYNGPDLARRLRLYPLLQLAKFLPVLLLLRPTAFGAVVVLCQVATMSAIYLTYRMGGRSKDVRKESHRVLMLATGTALFLCTPAVGEAGWVFQLACLAVWCAARLFKAPVLRALRRSPPA